MGHFGIICPPVSGHIHPFAALGRELIARGHRVTCFQVVDLESKIRSEGLEFASVGERDHPRGSLPRALAALGQLHGLAALRFTIDAVARTSEMICRDAPEAIRRTGPDALLVDQMEPAGGAVAEHLGLPFVTVCNALPINRDPVAPPPFTPWGYRTGPLARLRTPLGYAISDWLTRPVTSVVKTHRSAWHLPRLRTADDSFSRLAQISQMPEELDFPRIARPVAFHYVGPLRRPTQTPPSFPWERLDGRPLVYASLGTLQNSREPLFRLFCEACLGLDVQLVISHGGGLTPAEVAGLPGNPLVVSYAPQVELLERARLTITHAGLNTVLDSLANGVPLVMVPITYEQPAIARRVEWVGAGRSIPLARLDRERLRRAVLDVLGRRQFQDAASRLQDAIGRAGRVTKAADLVEAVTRVPRAIETPADTR